MSRFWRLLKEKMTAKKPYPSNMETVETKLMPFYRAGVLIWGDGLKLPLTDDAFIGNSRSTSIAYRFLVCLRENAKKGERILRIMQEHDRSSTCTCKRAGGEDRGMDYGRGATWACKYYARCIFDC